MPFIIGTAGHIDHGKTSLVKALTGQDTDRLKEEKVRGISIDLGFAHFDLPDGTRAGVVDVPGHERFIRNMLAGAHGIDVVLFTVAADDGVMPQTDEHLDILHLLGIRRAIFVVTKIDTVSESRIAEVEDDVRILIAGTLLEQAPVVRFSFVTGEGLEAVRAALSAVLYESEQRRSHGYFRLPIDRVFVLQGHGVVVTGTATSGKVHAGERVRCVPGTQTFRVRSLHVHNEAVESASEGQRVALNLTGPDTPSIERGHVICDEKLSLTSTRFDTWLEVRPGARSGLKNHQRVRVHLGTAERLGRLFFLTAGDTIEPKRSAYCQVTVEEPLHVLRGDHFIVRDETSQRTLGGGVVVHPWARKRKRTEASLIDRLERLRSSDRDKVPEAVEAFVDDDSEFALPIAKAGEFLNMPEEEVRTRLSGASSLRLVNLDGALLYSSATKWEQASTRLVDALGTFHAAHPLLPGMDIEASRDQVEQPMSPRLFRAFIDQMEASGLLVREASLLRLRSHSVRLRDDENAMIEKLKSLLGAEPVTPPDLAALERQSGIPKVKLTEILRVMERGRLVVRVSPDLYFLADAIDRVTKTLHARWSGSENIAPGAFRDAVGTTRKFAIPLLQYLDQVGVTVRIGDTRRLKKA